MNLRLAVFDLAAAWRLPPHDRRRLLELAGFGVEPAGLLSRLAQGLAVVAASLGGMGLVMWIAANWDDFGRAGRFALLQGVVVVMGLGAWRRPAARPALGLLTLLAVGALLAYFGQTYQSGADPWQLFALWAALGLPLALGVRSDAVWAPWTLVAMTAVSLWTQAHTGHARWWGHSDLETTPVYLAGWAMSIALVLALGPALRGKTGAGVWAMRTAVTLSVTAITFSAVLGLFGSVGPLYWLGLMMMAAAGWLLSRRGHFDVFALSAAVLALDTLLVSGLARWLLDNKRLGDWYVLLLLIGVAAAALVAASVHSVMRVARARAVSKGWS